MKVNIQSMNTPEGNALVQRIADAAVKMNEELGATDEQCEQFMRKSLKTLACAKEFAEADSVAVRLDVFYEYDTAPSAQVA